MNQREIFQALEANADQIADAMNAMKRSTAEGGQTLTNRDVVLRLWNQAVDQDVLDEARKQTLITQLAWANDSALVRERNHETVCTLAQHLDECGLSITLDIDDSKYDFLRNLLIGIASNLVNTISASAEKAGDGRLRIDWTDQTGSISWDDEEDSDYRFVPIAMASAKHFGGMNDESAVQLAEFLASELRLGRLRLPLFQLNTDVSDDLLTELYWRIQEPVTLHATTEPTEAELEEARSMPVTIELTLWKDYPEVAEVLEQAICHALVQDQQSAGSDTDIGRASSFGINDLIEFLQKITGWKTPEEVREFLTLAGPSLSSSVTTPVEQLNKEVLKSALL
ncbi:MAG: hypothetical protein AAGG48_17980 [Planctomycetota bacterium]